MVEAQNASHVLMIRPVNFAANPQTVASNHFQRSSVALGRTLQECALAEFETLAGALSAAGVGVVVFEDTYEPHTPDAIFPNNWVSFHADGTVLLYPMLAPNRRMERRPELLDALVRCHGFQINQIIDLAYHEKRGHYLEGTGSLVLDRMNRCAYACMSPRTSLEVLADFSKHLQYEVVTFEARDLAGAAIYHTNVMLSIGRRLAVVCTQSVRAEQRAFLLERLRIGGRTVIELSQRQMQSFAGNVLELCSSNGEPLLVMSERARQSLTVNQQVTLERLAGRIISVSIPTIEQVGGGSVRCMLAEIHLPLAHAAISSGTNY
jgi:hypothetical protein